MGSKEFLEIQGRNEGTLDQGSIRTEQQIQMLTRVGKCKEVEPLQNGDWRAPHTIGQRTDVTGTMPKGFHFSLNPLHGCVKTCYHPHYTDRESQLLEGLDFPTCCPEVITCISESSGSLLTLPMKCSTSHIQPTSLPERWYILAS